MEPIQKEDFTFRLYGEGIKPESFKAREVGKLITQLEGAFQYYLEAREGKDSKEFYLSLVDVRNESLDLDFLPHSFKSFVAAFLTITTSITTGDYSAIPTKTIQQFQEIQKIVKSKNCVAEFIHDGEVFASIGPNTTIAIPETGWIRGETVIYGEIKRVGGKEPTATIELDTGGIITCNVSRPLAKRLGAKLYAQVALKGYASWAAADYQLLDFRIESIIDYLPTTNTKAFNRLKESLGTYWDAVEDVDTFLLNNES